VDQSDVGREQVFDAVAANGVGVAAAKFHQRVMAFRLDFLADAGGEVAGQVAVAEFIQVFHR